MLLVVALVACGKEESGWKVLEHKSKKTDEREFSVIRVSAEEFSNDRNPSAPRWRVQLEVKLHPDFEVLFWTGYEAQSWANKAEAWYRLDGSDADTIAVRVDKARATLNSQAAPAMSIPQSVTLATMLLRASELKVGYRQIGNVDQVATFNLKGLRAAIEDACKRAPNAFDCSRGAVRRVLDEGALATPSCMEVGIHIVDLLRSDPATTSRASRLEMIDTMRAACAKDPHTPGELACLLEADTIAATRQCAGK